MLSFNRRIAVSMLAMTITGLESQGAVLSKAFTYQGRLESGGAAADGTYDFHFRLMTAVTGGFSVGLSIPLEDVMVQDGLFTVTLNENNEFGSDAFNGSPRWLDIWVRPGNQSSNYTALAPRQSVTAAPYALAAGSLAVPSSAQGDTNAFIGTPTGLLSITQDGSAAAILATAQNDGVGVHAIAGGTRPAISAKNSGGGPAMTIESGALRVVGAGFNTNTCVFIHSASTDSPITVIDNPMTNGDSGAILMVTPQKYKQLLGPTRTGKASATMYNYETGRWELHSLGANHQDGDSYSILVIKS